MPADRDDAPLGEAVDPLFLIDALALKRIAAAPSLNAARDARPAAARWRLIGWLATGLEPTEAMVVQASDGWTETGSYRRAITAALAAAREARDE